MGSVTKPGLVTQPQLDEIEELYEQYCEWCKANGLFPNGLSVEFFDWMEGAA